MEAEEGEVIEPGIYPNMSMEAYHAEKAWLSKSSLMLLLDNAARFKAWRDGKVKEKETTQQRIGTAAHMFINERDKFDGKYHIMPSNVARNANQAPYKEQLALAGGREILKQHEYDGLTSMLVALAEDPRGRLLLKNDQSVAEQSYFFVDPETGAQMKTRPDHLRLNDDIAIDIKVVTSCEPDAFSRSAFDFGYDLSPIITAIGYKAITGRELRGYFFVVIEREPPHLIECFSTDNPTYMRVGLYRVREALARYQRCMGSGDWPGYSESVVQMSVPAYELKKLEGFV